MGMRQSSPKDNEFVKNPHAPWSTTKHENGIFIVTNMPVPVTTKDENIRLLVDIFI
jgi:hypothetical protein